MRTVGCYQFHQFFVEKNLISYKNLSEHLSTGNDFPDLIVRTGGYKRLSNFMLWQAAYSELIFIDTLWPEFSSDDVSNILQNYKSIKRKFLKSGSMTEFFKRIATITILVSILSLLFLYGSNTSVVIAIYLITLLSFHEWLSITSKSKYYILPFFVLIPSRLQ